MYSHSLTVQIFSSYFRATLKLKHIAKLHTSHLDVMRGEKNPQNNIPMYLEAKYWINYSASPDCSNRICMWRYEKLSSKICSCSRIQRGANTAQSVKRNSDHWSFKVVSHEDVPQNSSQAMSYFKIWKQERFLAGVMCVFDVRTVKWLWNYSSQTTLHQEWVP